MSGTDHSAALEPGADACFLVGEREEEADVFVPSDLRASPGVREVLRLLDHYADVNRSRAGTLPTCRGRAWLAALEGTPRRVGRPRSHRDHRAKCHLPSRRTQAGVSVTPKAMSLASSALT